MLLRDGDFDEMFALWVNHPETRRWNRDENWRIYQYVKDGVHYHASFLLDTRTYKLHQMKSESWRNGLGFSLVIDRRIV